jgi:beta-lactam-binding protein with PASTA domain
VTRSSRDTRQAATPARPPAAVSPQPQTSPSAAPVTTVSVPKVVGKNGAIAREELAELGFAKVELAADPKSGRQIVLNPANWTVTKVEPAAGTSLRSNQTVVLTLTK